MHRNGASFNAERGFLPGEDSLNFTLRSIIPLPIADQNRCMV